MSIITESLEKIVNWLRVNDPESISELRPGLSESEIEKLTKPLSLHLPGEVREIYRFCNGGISLDGDYSLVLDPLEVAIENARYPDWMRGDKIPNSSHIFPLFHGDGKQIYYIVWDERENDFPVWYVFVGGEPLEYAASLTSLIVTTWEGYETGAYYIELDEEGYPYVEVNLDKFEKIFQKHNPKQIENWKSIWVDE